MHPSRARASVVWSLLWHMVCVPVGKVSPTQMGQPRKYREGPGHAMLTTKHFCHLTHTHAHMYTHPHVRTCVFIAPSCHVSTLVGHALGTSGSPRGSVSTYVLTFTAMTEENMVYQHYTFEFHPEVTCVASVLIALATSQHHTQLPRWKECLEGGWKASFSQRQRG